MQTASNWPLLEHLLRRAGFGATPIEREYYAGRSYTEIVDELVGFDPASTDIDHLMQTPGHAGVTARNGVFTPNTVINDARQRWLFRMVHSPAPLQEKMALFWHHHFATAYSKVAGSTSASDATRMLDARPSTDTAGVRGQIEMFRQLGVGSFRDLLVEVARDPAMIVWLDGRTNFKRQPQENFGRELMELFTFGIGNYTEADVYAAARVFTGWNLRQVGTRNTPEGRYDFNYNAGQHDTDAKTFTFAIYPNGGTTIPARAAANGMQDGLDLIHALATHPQTARRLASRLWTWFVSDIDVPDPAWVEQIAAVYLANDTQIRPVLRQVLLSSQFRSPGHFFARYAWPAEYVVRAMKEVGYVGFSVNDALSPMLNMGQQLFEPPDVNGWAIGPSWFSTGAMLARMNFASTLVANQRFEVRNAARNHRTSPQTLLDFAVNQLSMPALPAPVQTAMLDYVRAGGTWTGSDPHVAFVNGTSSAALATLDRVASVASYTGTVQYANNGLAQALKAVAGAIARGIGTKVFWVQTGGFDTHAGQGTNAANGAYTNLMGTVGDSLLAFYTDMRNQGLLQDTLVLQFSEFGRRVIENGSSGTDHGAAGVMMALGGGVNGGLYGSAANLDPANADGTLENNGNDVRYETDFRAVYARVLDQWLGADSIPILGGDFRNNTLTFL